jgi:hypothetical protein
MLPGGRRMQRATSAKQEVAAPLPAAVTSPVLSPGPGGTNGTNITTILTSPEELKPPPPNNGTAGPPSAQLNSNCTLVVTDATGQVTWTSNTTSTNGPCSLTLDNQGQLCIKDLYGVSIWCNNATTNGTACAPYSLTTTTAGQLIEADSCSGTAEPVWRALPADADGGALGARLGGATLLNSYPVWLWLVD